MENAKKIATDVVINASKERVWEALFTRFGEASIYNPNLEGSHFTKGSIGEVGCERQCSLDSKMFVKERIVKADPLKKFTVDIFGGNMPMVKKMMVDLEINPIGNSQTRVILSADFNAKPAFMGSLMKGSMKKKFTDMLIGLKYHLETGNRVSKKTYKPIYKQYQQLQLNQSF
ncbi:MAG: SRPBCC family protein [Ignavibacteriales bacterium]|nr:SRPBCC family protein [Ignavibacteriales bacterium]